MNPERFRQLVSRVPLVPTAIGCIALVLATGVWPVRVLARLSTPPSVPAIHPGPPPGTQTPGAGAGAGPGAVQRAVVVPDAVLTLSLSDELFPRPIAAAQLHPERGLKLELIAITGEGAGGRAFVRDPQADVYYDLMIGEPASPGVTLAEINATGVVFAVSGQRVALELPK